MRILVVSACDHRMESEAQVSEASIRRAIHGLPDWACEFHRIPDDYPRTPYWAKIGIVRRALERAPYVLWIDADAVMLRPPTPAETEELLDGNTLHICKDPDMINTGVMGWRACDEAREALDRVEREYHKYPGIPWNEQGVLQTFVDTLKVRYLTKVNWNAYAEDVRPDSLIRHWVNDPERRRKMKLWQGY